MARKKTKRRAAKKKSPTVTVRFANGAKMAKRTKRRKSSGKRRRRNPTANPANPRRRRRSHARKVHHRRRRNPAGGFGDRLVKLGLGAAVALGTGVAVTYGMGKIMPGSKASLYGVPAVAFVAGVAMAKSMPTLGVGVALGAFTPFALPLASKMLSAGIPSANASTAGAISRAYRSMRSVQTGAVNGWHNSSLGSVDMHGPDLMMYGATSPRDPYRARYG